MAEDYETDDYVSESTDDHLISDPDYSASKESIQFANSDSDLDAYDHIVEENIEDDHALTVEDQGDNIPVDDNTEDELQRVMQSLAATLNDIPSHDHRLSQHFVPMTISSIRHMLAELGPGFRNQPLMDLIPTRAHRYVETQNITLFKMLVKIKRYLFDVVQGRESAPMPTRSPEHAKYVTEASRVVQGRHMVDARLMTNSTKILASLGIIYQNLIDGVYMTLRGLYYLDKATFKTYGSCVYAIHHIACMFDCTRLSLDIKPESRGMVVGPLTYEYEGAFTNCKLSTGINIPSFVDQFQNIRSDANFILVVEKNTIFERLVAERFHEDYPCIIITGRGQPCMPRSFLKKIKEELEILAFGLVDCNPKGIEILSTYKWGSVQLAYDNYNLVVLDIMWLGLRPSDYERYEIPPSCKLEWKDDVHTA